MKLNNKIIQNLPAILLTLGVLVLFAVLAKNVYQTMLGDTQVNNANAAAQEKANVLVGTVNKFINEQQSQLKRYVKPAEFIKAIQHQNHTALKQYEQQMPNWTHNVSAGYILGLNDVRLRNSQNYVGLALLSQLRSGETVQPEAAFINGHWKLLFPYPLYDANSDVQGMALLLIGLQELQNQLEQDADATMGKTIFAQLVNGQPGRPMISSGVSSDELKTVQVATSMKHWVIQYQGSPLLMKSETKPSSELYLVLGALTLGAALLIYLIVRINAFLKRKNLPAQETTESTGSKEKLQPKPKKEQPQEEDFLEIVDSSPHDEEPTNNDGLPPAGIFRDYDIRGLAGSEITPNLAIQLGKAMAAKAREHDETTLIVGYDGRNSSPELAGSLQRGIMISGCSVMDLGQVPTPMLHFACQHLAQSDSGIMVTASHNPSRYNGFKLFFKHHTLCGEEVSALRGAIGETYTKSASPGKRQKIDLRKEYIEAVSMDIVPADDIKVVVDGGNGAAGELAVATLEAIGCEVIPLFCEVDGNFPNREPDTTVEENLSALKEAIAEHSADLGIALDGDGDRVVAISSSGVVAWPDELLMIFARDVLSRSPGADIVFDVKSTRRLNQLISSYGGRPVMWKTGHAHIHNKIVECNAPLGGEFSGHIFFKDRWHGCDDGIYAAARLVEILTIREQPLDEVLQDFEPMISTPEIKVPVPDSEKFTLMELLLDIKGVDDASVNQTDGLRVDFPNGWGLVRASNTSAALTLRFEANSQEELERIQTLFREHMQAVDPSLDF